MYNNNNIVFHFKEIYGQCANIFLVAVKFYFLPEDLVNTEKFLTVG